MRVELAQSVAPRDPALRAPTVDDIPALGRLMLTAFAGTPDDEGEDLDEAVAEIRKTFAGGYGDFLPDASRVHERDGALLAAVLVTRWRERPLVAFTMTDPGARRGGLARACMLFAMARLHAAGERELGLAVTVANTPAIALYESLGFTVQP